MSDLNQPPMSPPDWGRWLVQTPHALAPVGDPTRWGATEVTQFVDTGGAFSIIATPQIIQIATKDFYSRQWSIVGTLQMDSGVWAAPGDYPFPVAAISVNVFLEIVAGVGQAQITQRIMLACSGDPIRGLCNQQCAANGGPYGEIFGLHAPGAPFSAQTSRPFAAVGAIAGNNISIRAVYEFTANEYSPATLSLLVSPIAAGTQL